MMDQILHQETLNLLSKYKLLKKVFQFILSLSIFSLVISYSSWFSLFLHSFNVYLSSSPFHLLNCNTIDRKYLFLVCNGIIVFLSTNYSSLIGCSSSSSLETHQNEFSNTNYVVENEVQVQSGGKEEEGEQFEEEDEKENGILITNEQVEEKYEEEEKGVLVTNEDMEVEDMEEDDGGNGSLSTEELNKKFDEFIRKMKEEIRFEHQRQLMVV